MRSTPFSMNHDQISVHQIRWEHCLMIRARGHNFERPSADTRHTHTPHQISNRVHTHSSASLMKIFCDPRRAIHPIRLPIINQDPSLQIHSALPSNRQLRSLSGITPPKNPARNAFKNRVIRSISKLTHSASINVTRSALMDSLRSTLPLFPRMPYLFCAQDSAHLNAQAQHGPSRLTVPNLFLPLFQYVNVHYEPNYL